MAKGPSEQLILITGASGFVAAHVLNEFLSAGYKVRGTVRSENSANQVRQSHAKYADRLSFAIVPDILAPSAFDEAVKGVDGVIHTASPFVLAVEDNERDLLKPAILGTQNILKSVHAHAPQVRRVVITSSYAALADMSKGAWPGHTYTEEDWNPDTYELAAKKDTSGVIAYCASKKLAEKAAWDFLEKEKPNFTVATICPPMVYGPLLQEKVTIKTLNSSAADIYQFMAPTNKPDMPVATQFVFSWVDARDVSLAHLRAYEKEEAANQRFFIVGGNFSYQGVCDIIRKNLPELRDRVPIGKPGTEFGGMELYKVNNEKSRKILGLTYPRSLEETMTDTARSLLELEKKA
ncbi:MAG: hypothetical protein M1834_002642 [Cirrosporium novae-zelandiae]|nr:MAG: hypothetical protein M1834_002642 [Cirrosporium novae-zelandiae]